MRQNYTKIKRRFLCVAGLFSFLFLLSLWLQAPYPIPNVLVTASMGTVAGLAAYCLGQI